MRESDYKLAGQVESGGPAGEIGVRILVNVGGGRALTSNEQKIVSETVDELHAKIVRQIRLEDPEMKRHIEATCHRLIGCFRMPIHVRKVDDPRAGFLPSFIVTTAVGPISIAQYGRQIRINWSNSDITEEACELFSDYGLFSPSKWNGPGRIYTGGESREIIADSYEAATACVDRIVNNVLHEVIDSLIKEGESVRRKLAANEPSKHEHKK